MSEELQKAAVQAQRVVKQFRDMVGFANALSELGNLDRIDKDLQAASLKSKVEYEKVQKDLDQIYDKLKKAKKTLGETHAEASHVKEQTALAIRALERKAKDQASRIIDDAQLKAANIHEDINKEKNKYEDWKNASIEEGRSLEGTLKSLKSSINELKKQFV